MELMKYRASDWAIAVEELSLTSHSFRVLHLFRQHCCNFGMKKNKKDIQSEKINFPMFIFLDFYALYTLKWWFFSFYYIILINLKCTCIYFLETVSNICHVVGLILRRSRHNTVYTASRLRSFSVSGNRQWNRTAFDWMGWGHCNRKDYGSWITGLRMRGTEIIDTSAGLLKGPFIHTHTIHIITSWNKTHALIRDGN